MIAAPRNRARRQRGLDRDHRIKPGHDVGKGHADLLRRSIGIAGQVHHPAHPLDDEVIARAAGIRPVLPEPGDRAIDEARISGGQAGIIQPVLRERADLEILDHDVGIRDQTLHFGLTCGGGEIDHHRRLAAIGRVEIGGVARPVGVGYERRPPLAGIVPCRALDLDHIRAKVGKDLTRPRPRENAREFDHLEAG